MWSFFIPFILVRYPDSIGKWTENSGVVPISIGTHTTKLRSQQCGLFLFHLFWCGIPSGSGNGLKIQVSSRFLSGPTPQRTSTVLLGFFIFIPRGNENPICRSEVISGPTALKPQQQYWGLFISLNYLLIGIICKETA
jgi:hypothetical protein